MGSQVRDQYADTRNDGLKHPFVPTTCAIVYVKCVCVCVCVCVCACVRVAHTERRGRNAPYVLHLP